MWWDNHRRKEFERLMLPSMPAAYRLAYAIVRNGDEAADVVQDAYLQAWKGFAGYRGDGAAAWILTIVRNAACRSLRRRARHTNVIPFDPAAPAMETISPEPSPEMVAVHRDELLRLQAALDQLPMAFREVLLLREIEGLSYQEIAGVVGVPAGTVMSRLHRARLQLRAALADRPVRETGE